MLIDYRRFRKDLARLTELSKKLLLDIEAVTMKKNVEPEKTLPGVFFFASYHNWYSEALRLIAQVMPARLAEFEALYSGEPGRKTIDLETYAVRDMFLDFDPPANAVSLRKLRVYARAAANRFHLQYRVCEAAVLHFENLLVRHESSGENHPVNETAAVRASQDINRIIVANKDALFADGDASFWEKSFTLGADAG